MYFGVDCAELFIYHGRLFLTSYINLHQRTVFTLHKGIGHLPDEFSCSTCGYNISTLFKDSGAPSCAKVV